MPFTCNFKTFIFRHEGNIVIDTCNNHCWNNTLDYLDSYEDGDGIYNLDFDDIVFNNIMTKEKITKKEFENKLYGEYI